MKTIKHFVLGVALLFFIIPQVDAQLVGTGFQGEDGLSSFYTIDEGTGVATLVGSVGFERCGSLAVHPTTGVLYSICERADGSDLPVLVSIDPATGAGTEIGVAGIHSFGDAYADGAFRSDGVYFVYLESSDGLGTVDLSTGALTELGATDVNGCCGNGIAFDDSDILYHANEEALHTLDQTTGAATEVIAIDYVFETDDDYDARMLTLAFDPVSGVLYGVENAGGSGEGGGEGGGGVERFLSTIDIATGVVTRISTESMGPIASVVSLGEPVVENPVPTMSQWGVMILGLLTLIFGLVTMRQRKIALG